MSGYPFIIQGKNIVIVVGNKSHTVNSTHLSYDKIKDAIKAEDWLAIPDLLEPKKVILKYGSGNVTIVGDTLYWKGAVMHNALTNKVIAMLGEGFPLDPMIRFMHNLMANPSKRAVTELYGFLEKGNLPITPDGHFLAYKKVRDNYKDVHSGTFDNSVGQICEMERNEVDDDKDRTCSAGLHFCSEDYLRSFGGERVMILKINPADVVSIPSDYNDSKGRACRYEVVGEVNGAPEKAFTSSVQEDGDGPWVFTHEDADEPEEDEFDFDSLMDTLDQDYDSRGRPLSMSTSAVAKRKSRAAAKAEAAFNQYRAGAVRAAAKQDYDSRGRALSMTPGAIAKRKARATVTSVKVAPGVIRTSSSPWPFPKA
jgi:hypothetical protein